MIPDWETDKIYFSEKLKIKFPKTFSLIESEMKVLEQKPEFLPKTNDVWARDYMPVQINEESFVEYRYDPDYLQGSSDEKQTRDLKSYPDIICDQLGIASKKSEIIIDGGNIVKSENSIILTDKVLWENKRHFSKIELIKRLHDDFEVDKVVLIPWDEGCEFGHSDGMLRFINNETVLISGFYEQMDADFRSNLIKPLEKAKLNCEWLRLSQKEKESNISYINFLQTKDLILVPFLNKKVNQVAIETIRNYFSSYLEPGKIRGVDMSEIVRYGGALNCISWTIKDGS